MGCSNQILEWGLSVLPCTVASGCCRAPGGYLCPAPLVEAASVERGTQLGPRAGFLNCPGTRGQTSSAQKDLKERGHSQPQTTRLLAQREPPRCLGLGLQLVALRWHRVPYTAPEGIKGHHHTLMFNPSQKPWMVLCAPLHKHYTFVLFASSENSSRLQRLNFLFQKSCWFN